MAPSNAPAASGISCTYSTGASRASGDGSSSASVSHGAATDHGELKGAMVRSLALIGDGAVKGKCGMSPGTQRADG
jgi:hypothetical protein